MEILLAVLVAFVVIAIFGVVVRRSSWNAQRETRFQDNPHILTGIGSDTWLAPDYSISSHTDSQSSSVLGLSGGQDFSTFDEPGNRFEGIEAGVSGEIESHVGANQDFSGDAGGGYFDGDTGGGDFGGDAGGGGDSGGGDSGGGD